MKRQKWATAFLVLALFSGCSKTRRNESRGLRIVSLSPSTTEAIVAIGAREQLVGRSRYCNFPPGIESVPQVGGYVDPNFEAILALHPDWVIGARGPLGQTLTDRLSTHGIQVFFPETESVDQIRMMITGLGERTRHTSEAAAITGQMSERLGKLEAIVAARPKVRVLLVFGMRPIVVAGPKSFSDEMLRRAGADNVVTEGPSYPTLGLEKVMALDPDLVVNAAAAMAATEEIQADTPGWKDLRAVKQGRVASLRDESILRPGPRVADGIAALARAVHPEVAAVLP